MLTPQIKIDDIVLCIVCVGLVALGIWLNNKGTRYCSLCFGEGRTPVGKCPVCAGKGRL